jgi:hypothetical protein
VDNPGGKQPALRLATIGVTVCGVNSAAADTIRPLLYGDVPLDDWAAADAGFQSAREALAANDTAAAVAELRAIVSDPDRPSRDALQAWNQLRILGETPAEPAHVYGVVVDMPIGDGLDTLAAYADGTCRYLNHAGNVLVYEGDEADDAEIGRLVRAVIAIGATIAAQIGPWDGARPPLKPGLLRMSMLCAGGLYFGEGPVSALASEPLGGRLLTAATGLLHALTKLPADN